MMGIGMTGEGCIQLWPDTLLTLRRADRLLKYKRMCLKRGEKIGRLLGFEGYLRRCDERVLALRS